MDTEKEEPDYQEGIDDDTDDDAINCWVCNSCGKIESVRPPWGGQCPRCGCVMEEDFI